MEPALKFDQQDYISQNQQMPRKPLIFEGSNSKLYFSQGYMFYKR